MRSVRNADLMSEDMTLTPHSGPRSSARLVAASRTPTTRGDRRLHLVDVENLLGARHRHASDANVRAVLARWLWWVGRRPDDHVVLAAHPGLGVAAGLAVDGAQLLVAHGRHGADLALLDWASVDHIAGRYRRVVLGSGDGIFTPFVRALRHRGVGIHACTRPGAMSSRLRAAIEATDTADMVASAQSNPCRRPLLVAAG